MTIHLHTCRHCDGTGDDPEGGSHFDRFVGTLKDECPQCEGAVSWECWHECTEGEPDVCECKETDWIDPRSKVKA